jgi:HSP20 family protein
MVWPAIRRGNAADLRSVKASRRNLRDNGRLLGDPPFLADTWTMEGWTMTERQHKHPEGALRDQMAEILDLLYDRVGKYHHGVSGHVALDHRPPADVQEADTGLEISLELPGMAAEDLEIVAGEGTLTVRGEKTTGREEKGRTYILRERRSGSFERSFAVGANLDPEGTKASFEQGVLTLRVPLKPGAKRAAKQIPIKSG